MTGTCCSLDTLVTARSVRVGDTVFVVGASGSAVTPVSVTSLGRVVRQGSANVHTLGGSIVVSGVAASHFTTETSWDGPSRPYAPLWYRVVDAVSWLTGPENRRSSAPSM